MWVDMGGEYGQKTVALKRACPDLPGRFVVQYLPYVIENALKSEGIETTGHDFFTEQPIQDRLSLLYQWVKALLSIHALEKLGFQAPLQILIMGP